MCDCVCVCVCIHISGVWEFKNSINVLLDLRSTVTKNDLNMFNFNCFEHRPLVFLLLLLLFFKDSVLLTGHCSPGYGDTFFLKQ